MTLCVWALEKPPAGIGLVITSDKPLHYVVQYIVPGLPASQADIKIGDEVLAVDGLSSEKIHNLDELVARIRGEKGTSVTLKIATSGNAREVSLIRGEIPELRSQAASPPINFGRESATYFYQREDFLQDDVAPGFLGDHSVRGFLRKSIQTLQY